MTQTRLADPLVPRRLLLGLGLAAILGATAPATHAAPAEAIAPIQGFDAGLLGVMRAGKATAFDRRFDMLAPIIDRTFDLETILQAVVGARWASLPEPEKAALRTEFRRFTIASWVANFDSFGGEVFSVMPDTRPLADGQVVVDTRFAAPGGTPVGLSYVMRQGASGWRAIDILAEGTISRVAVMRSDFRHVLAQGGGPALVARLKEKTANLAAGKAE